MSEEKIYLIKNDHGEYLTVERTAPWRNSPVVTAVRNIDVALAWAEKYGGHVVTFVEEPEKVVITKEQAEIVERAHDSEYPASCISSPLLMNAYVNGYTVAKEKKYLLPMPGTDYHNYQMHGNAQYYAVKGTGNWRPDAIALGTDDAVKHGYTVTQSDIDAAPAWVKAIKPVEVTDDGND